MFRFLTAVMLAGAVAAALGGLAFAVLFSVDDVLARNALPAVLAGLAGLFAMGLLTLLAAATRALVGREPKTAPATAPARLPARKGAAEPDLKTAYDQMRTYIDLEMWELALDKAGYILGKFPGTNEAELVSKNLPEIKWKVETAAAPSKQLTPADEKQLQKKGLADMLHHVKTYCDLGMWELARQKAITIMKSFPNSPEADELAKLYPEIERKAAKMTSETPAAPAASDVGPGT